MIMMHSNGKIKKFSAASHVFFAQSLAFIVETISCSPLLQSTQFCQLFWADDSVFYYFLFPSFLPPSLTPSLSVFLTSGFIGLRPWEDCICPIKWRVCSSDILTLYKGQCGSSPTLPPSPFGKYSDLQMHILCLKSNTLPENGPPHL